jgi:hypothetical protein
VFDNNDKDADCIPSMHPLLPPELLTKVFTNERMCIQLPRIMRTFSGKES